MSSDGPRPDWTLALSGRCPIKEYDENGHIVGSAKAAAAAAAAAAGAQQTGGDGSDELKIEMSPEVAAAALAGGCPVVHTGSAAAATDAAPGPASAAASKPSADAEPQLNPDNNMMIEEKQRPAAGQVTPLPTQRRMSTIRKSGVNPSHQLDQNENWEYPSQQMFFNAMKRKGHNPQEEEMSTIVGMHNAVNEHTWQKLLGWEKKLHPETADQVRLKKFSGDANNFSLKAQFNNLLGNDLPFDRHDWIVHRGEGSEDIHYVVDFYNAKGGAAADGIGILVDVRPALDSPGNVIDRFKMSFAKLADRGRYILRSFQQPPAAPTSKPAAPKPMSPDQVLSSRRWGNLQ